MIWMFLLVYSTAAVTQSLYFICFVLAYNISPTLTALLHGVASLQVITGPGRMFPTAIRALHVADLAAEGLQSGQDAWVHRNYSGGVAVGHSLVLTELRRRGRARVIILRVGKELVYSGNGRPRGSGKAYRALFSWRTLWIWKLCCVL